jgi:hypothetical protein
MEQRPRSTKILATIVISIFLLMSCSKGKTINTDPDPNPDPGITEGTRLYPDDLAYKGAFRVPHENSTLNGGVSYGRGYTAASTMNWDSKHNSILMPGLSNSANYMGGFAPVQPIISATKNAKELNTAVMNPSLPFTDLTNGIQGNYHILTSVYFNGSRYLWTLFNTYDVAAATRERFGISSAWASNKVVQLANLADKPPRQWGRWIVDIDDQWANKNLGHKAFGLGSSRTNGSFGPSIYFIDKEFINNPSSSIPNVQGIYYDANHTVNSFSPADMYSDAVWVNYNGKRAYLVLVRCGFRVEPESPKIAYRGSDRWWSTSGIGKSIAYKNKDVDQTILTGAISDIATTIPVADASILPSKGYIGIGSELIYYDAIDRTTNTLLNCTRGMIIIAVNVQTQAAAHASGSAVTQYMPDILFYGNNQDGYDSVILIPMLHFYDVDQIAEIVRGERQPWDIRPYAYMTLDQEFYRSMGALNGDVGLHAAPLNSNGRIYTGFDLGIALDPTGNLYIGENDGDPEIYGRWPIIHQYAIIGTGVAPSTTAPSAPANVTVNSSGVVSWQPSNGNVLYVIFKWFDEPHYSVPQGEYRPIRTSLAPTWTDRYYKSGDKYQIIAYDRNMNASSPAQSN